MSGYLCQNQYYHKVSFSNQLPVNTKHVILAINELRIADAEHNIPTVFFVSNQRPVGPKAFLVATMNGEFFKPKPIF